MSGPADKSTTIGQGALKSLFQFGYRRSPDQDRATPAHHPVVVIGAGPIGLSVAIDLAHRGHAVVLVDDADRIGEGSRAICYSKRALEAWERLGVGTRMVEKGVQWQVGRVHFGDELIYSFDLLPETGHRMPAFINLQQYYAEAYLVDRIRELPQIDVRWRNKVVAVENHGNHVTIGLETPDGLYSLTADWVLACDGARSPVRAMMGARFIGETFEEQFLIADVKMHADFPTERWFWFRPTFHDGQSALIHKQPDDVWRIDLQISADADAALERDPARVRERIRKMLGHDRFDFEWISIYRFQCRRMTDFVHGRVIFAGDSAHQVSPFGARGANSGIEDSENIAWKLDLLLRGLSPAGPLLESYQIERGAAADENILNSTRATDFMAPHGKHETRLRDAALNLARTHEFARKMVNGGRLSMPSIYDSPLSTPDRDDWVNGPRPGQSMIDAPLVDPRGASIFLTDAFRAAGCRFTLLTSGAANALATPNDLARIEIGETGLRDAEGLFASRWDAGNGAAWLVRPDGYIAARFRSPRPGDIDAALARAKGLG